MKRIFLFVVLMIAATAFLQAQATIDGNWLLLRYIDYQVYRLHLEHPETVPHQGAKVESNAWEWLGFIQAVFSFEEINKNMPNGFSVGQIGDIVGNYIVKHPEELDHNSAFWIALKAVHEAWSSKAEKRIIL